MNNNKYLKTNYNYLGKFQSLIKLLFLIIFNLLFYI